MCACARGIEGVSLAVSLGGTRHARQVFDFQLLIAIIPGIMSNEPVWQIGLAYSSYYSKLTPKGDDYVIAPLTVVLSTIVKCSLVGGKSKHVAPFCSVPPGGTTRGQRNVCAAMYGMKHVTSPPPSPLPPPAPPFPLWHSLSLFPSLSPVYILTLFLVYDAFRQFVFPDGMRLHGVETPPTTFPFVLTNSCGLKMHGAVLHVVEEIDPHHLGGMVSQALNNGGAASEGGRGGGGGGSRGGQQSRPDVPLTSAQLPAWLRDTVSGAACVVCACVCVCVGGVCVGGGVVFVGVCMCVSVVCVCVGEFCVFVRVRLSHVEPAGADPQNMTHITDSSFLGGSSFWLCTVQ